MSRPTGPTPLWPFPGHWHSPTRRPPPLRLTRSVTILPDAFGVRLRIPPPAAGHPDRGGPLRCNPIAVLTLEPDPNAESTPVGWKGECGGVCTGKGLTATIYSPRSWGKKNNTNFRGYLLPLSKSRRPPPHLPRDPPRTRRISHRLHNPLAALKGFFFVGQLPCPFQIFPACRFEKKTTPAPKKRIHRGVTG